MGRCLHAASFLGLPWWRPHGPSGPGRGWRARRAQFSRRASTDTRPIRSGITTPPACRPVPRCSWPGWATEGRSRGECSTEPPPRGPRRRPSCPASRWTADARIRPAPTPTAMTSRPSSPTQPAVCTRCTGVGRPAGPARKRARTSLTELPLATCRHPPPNSAFPFRVEPSTWRRSATTWGPFISWASRGTTRLGPDLSCC